MWKMALAGTTTLAIVGATLVHAQESSRGSETAGRGGAEQPPVRAEDVGPLADAGIAALKSGLGLTPEQERNWPSVEQALRALAKARSDRMTAQRETPPQSEDLIERLRRRADAMSQTAPLLKQLADAAQPLYQSLDDGQKRRFLILARLLRASLGQRRMVRERDAGGSGERGYGGGWGGRDEGRDWYDHPRWGGRHGGRGWGGRDEDRDRYERRGWGGRDGRDWYERRRHDGRGWGGRDDDRDWRDYRDGRGRDEDRDRYERGWGGRRDGRDWYERRGHDGRGWGGRDDNRDWRDHGDDRGGRDDGLDWL
jgi:zinc resistance-associated protein